jgi:hypothetical protein
MKPNYRVECYPKNGGNMGFWKSVGETALKIGKKAIDSTNAALKEAEIHKIEYRKYDDGKLKQILATGSFAKKNGRYRYPQRKRLWEKRLKWAAVSFCIITEQSLSNHNRRDKTHEEM